MSMLPFATAPETLQVGDTVYVAGSNDAHVILTDYRDGTVLVGRPGSDFTSPYQRTNLWKFDPSAYEAECTRKWQANLALRR
jgi:hypothetical protein